MHRFQTLTPDQLRRFLELSGDLFCVVGSDGYFTELSSRWEGLLGYSREELLEKPYLELVHPDDIEATRREGERLRSEGQTIHFVSRHAKKGGGYVWLEWTSAWDKHADHALSVARDITDKQRIVAELRESEIMHRSIVQGAVDAILIFDDAGIIESANPAAQRLLGWRPDELVGTSFERIAPGARRALRGRAGGEQSGREDGPRAGVGREVEAQRRNGTLLPADLSIVEFATVRGPRFIGMLHDLTMRKRIERMQAEFVSTVSHELRTPLTSIRGALGLVSGGAVGSVPPELRPMLDIAMANSERLIRIINDILDAERIESGNVIVDIQAHSADVLIDASIREMQPYAAQHGVELARTGQPCGLDVLVDAGRFHQVFANLVSNACKASNAGQRVIASVRSSGGRLRFEIVDRAGGVPESFRPRIFDRFAQADASDARSRGGSGLGLAIARGLVEMQGGAIGFDVEEGVGTTFWFELPVGAGDAAKARAKTRILVCDTEPEVTAELVRSFKPDVYLTRHASDVDEALAILKHEPFDAIVLNLGVVGSDARSVAVQLGAAHNPDEPIPVIKLSDEDFRGGSPAAALSASLARLLGQRATAGRSPSPSDEPVGVLPRVLHVEDDADNRRVVRELVRPLGECVGVSTLEDARKRLETESFAAVILDLSLPDGPGEALLAEGARRASMPPVIVFSSREPEGPQPRSLVATLIKSRVSDAELCHAIFEAVSSGVPLRSLHGGADGD